MNAHDDCPVCAAQRVVKKPLSPVVTAKQAAHDAELAEAERMAFLAKLSSIMFSRVPGGGRG